ncbi:hypothetical protein [Streptomyces sp. RKAG337]|uniref:hypothetical protein n=1 Tax=Streptomyces sp. RKAG337 TaxID=2893404 RepID=UPI0020347C95|nr:hypothetical protein [Streptomyces sp. RKAG337]MCM2426432.1 hypothetical protein [Streptomyces sp. RKAG337]
MTVARLQPSMVQQAAGSRQQAAGSRQQGLRACPGVLDGLRARLVQLDLRVEELDGARQAPRRAVATTERVE